MRQSEELLQEKKQKKKNIHFYLNLEFTFAGINHILYITEIQRPKRNQNQGIRAYNYQ